MINKRLNEFHRSIFNENRFRYKRNNKKILENNITPKQVSESLSCFMNSLLKCLYYIKELREYLIEKKDYFTEAQPVCKIVSSIMYKLKFNAKHHFLPEELQEIIGDKNNYIFGGRVGDSNCIFSSIIDSFLNELSINNIRKKDKPLRNYDLSNKKQIFKILYNENDKNNIINQIFLGYYETIYQCENNILTNIYSIQNEYFISFNLEQIQKFYNNQENITITQCFDYYCRKQSSFEFYCSKCDAIEKNDCYEKIYKPPLILVIILNKGDAFDSIIVPEPFLDLSTYIDGKEYQNESNYKLICYSSKYSACCMTDSGYYYDSLTVAKSIRESQIGIDEPFLLFYRRDN